MPRDGLRSLFSVKMIGLHLFTIILVATMIVLAFWQLDRHRARATFNESVRARSLEPARTIDDLFRLSDDPAVLEWYTVKVSGTYVLGANFLLVNRSQDGRAGVDPISTLQLDDGRLLLVNRGFVPLSIAPPPPPTGRVTVVGRVRASEERRRGQLSNTRDGELYEIQQLDIARLAAQLPGTVVPISIDLLLSEPSDSPLLSRIAEPTLTLGPHLSYTAQWFIFAICALVAWGFIVRRTLAARPPARTSTAAVAGDSLDETR